MNGAGKNPRGVNDDLRDHGGPLTQGELETIRELLAACDDGKQVRETMQAFPDDWLKIAAEMLVVSVDAVLDGK